MNRIAVYTLIDVTTTDVTNNDAEDQQQRNQQRNWGTVNQIINLRIESQVEAVPRTPMQVNVDSHKFGSYYRGYHQCWKFIFQFDSGIDCAQHLEKLRFDFDNVPIITGLDETIDLPYPVFCVNGALTNTYFRVL